MCDTESLQMPGPKPRHFMGEETKRIARGRACIDEIPAVMVDCQAFALDAGTEIADRAAGHRRP